MLSIAFNTNQVGRTFQDRSYLLQFVQRPAGVNPGTIYNLNNRGRRGNIVQCYPAVETDFIPNKLWLTTQDFLHIQFCGSDFNENNNANNGEGWRYSTRHNIVEMRDGDKLSGPQNNFPKTSSAQTMFAQHSDQILYAFVGQNPSTCGAYTSQDGNNGNVDNAYDNCGKLNMAAAHFNPQNTDGSFHMIRWTSTATYNYLGTRNNNFSNRSQKGVLVITNPSTLTSGQQAGIGIGVAAGVALIGFAGVRAYSKRNPNSKTAAVYEKLTNSTAQTWSRIKGDDATTAGV